MNEFNKLCNPPFRESIFTRMSIDLNGGVDISVDGDCWISAKNYDEAKKQYEEIIKEWNEDANNKND